MKIWFEREIDDSLKQFVPDEIEILRPASSPSANSFSTLVDAQGIIASIFVYDAEVIAQAPKVLVISRTGIGYDKVDLTSATSAGIAVCNAPDGPTISTAEYAISLMLFVAKNIKPIEIELRDELQRGTKRHFYKDYRGVELHSKQLGLIGYGRIGSHVARIARAIGMTIAIFDPYFKPNQVEVSNLNIMPRLEDLLSTSDVVSLHLPLTDDTHQFMNAERFAQMKQSAIFINTARGKHVDETALLDAIDSGHLFGAGLDVTNPEPPQADNPLLHRHNVIISPHIASGTPEAKQRNFQTALQQVQMVLRGERPPNLVNPEVWSHVLARLEK